MAIKIEAGERLTADSSENAHAQACTKLYQEIDYELAEFEKMTNLGTYQAQKRNGQFTESQVRAATTTLKLIKQAYSVLSNSLS